MDVDRAAVGVDDPFGDRQPEAVAALLARARFVDAVKAVENAADVFRRDADAGVFDGKEHVLWLGADRQRHLAAFGGVFDRVVEQNVQQLRQFVRVSGDERLLGSVKMHRNLFFSPPVPT